MFLPDDSFSILRAVYIPNVGKGEAFYCGPAILAVITWSVSVQDADRALWYITVFGTKSSTNLSAVECSDFAARIFTEHQYYSG